MRLLKAILVTGFLSATPSVAAAAIFTPSPTDLQDLQHQTAYAWNIDVGSIKTANVTSASLVFKNLYNATTTANELFIHLFNSLNLTGPNLPTPIDADPSSSTDPINVYKFTDTTSSTSINDGYTTSPSWVVGNVFLTQMSFPGPGQTPDATTGSSNPGDQMTYSNNGTPSDPTDDRWTYTDTNGNAASGGSSSGEANKSNGGTWTATYGKNVAGTQYYDYSYTFSANELATLNTYIDDGWIALGLDSDCTFYNDGASLNLTTTPSIPNPEPASLVLLGSGLAGLRAFQRRRRARVS